MNGEIRFQRHRLALTGVALVAVVNVSAGAQELGTADKPATSVSDTRKTDLDGLTEIIVTARRRDETLISTPVAVSAISGATLQQYATLPSYPAQREVVVRRMYKELTGNLP